MTKILVLPGIGDIYWVMTMLEDFCEQRRIVNPTVAVWDFEGRQRGIEYVQRIPFVKSGGYFVKPPHPHKLPAFRQSYQTGQRSIIKGLFGHHYYIAVNGAIRHGRSIADATKCSVNWYPTYTRTDAERTAEAKLRADFGDYIMLHFSAFGMFRYWTQAWPLEKCATFIQRVRERSGKTLLLTGAGWDRPFAEELAVRTGVVNLVGLTDADAFFGLLHGASAVAGWCGGNTILATTLQKPTMMLWSREFFPNQGFYRQACPPDAWDQWYLSRTVEDTSPEDAARDFLSLIQ